MEITTQILLNLLIAFVYMLLTESWNVVVFAIGYAMGFVIIFLMRRFFPVPFYGRKIIAIVKLFMLFIVELFKSTVVVALLVTRPKLNIQPGIFRSETILKTDLEITLLSALMTLTPGSVIMEIDPRAGVMFIHAMDASDYRNNITKTMRKFENAIIEVMR
ncbi:MAG: monovalent cation/H+ antiporter subunit [Paenibacillaceae bacterium]|jgi:multicomponent Na+:H+ antiporter subunit E|nr:monovalent cation/H+ antiporter subunit [Paenibacillaceae bacterium]